MSQDVSVECVSRKKSASRSTTIIVSRVLNFDYSVAIPLSESCLSMPLLDIGCESRESDEDKEQRTGAVVCGWLTVEMRRSGEFRVDDDPRLTVAAR